MIYMKCYFIQHIMNLQLKYHLIISFRLHERALHEQSNFIFRYCRPFQLSVFSNTEKVVKAPAASRNVSPSPSTECGDDMVTSNISTPNSPSSVLPMIGEYDPQSPMEDSALESGADTTEEKDNITHREDHTRVEQESSGTQPCSPSDGVHSGADNSTLLGEDDFSAKLGFLARIIFLISKKDSYDIFLAHAFRAIAAPILTAIHNLRLLVDCHEEGQDIGASASQLCSEVMYLAHLQMALIFYCHVVTSRTDGDISTGLEPINSSVEISKIICRQSAASIYRCSCNHISLWYVP